MGGMKQANIAAAILLILLFVAPAQAQLRAGPQGGEEGAFRKQLWLVPASDGRMLHVNVLRPRGDGPFPLVIMNHGSPASAKDRPAMPVPTFTSLSEWLLARGYAVALPLRRGYGETGGNWDEDYGRCDQPDFARAGLETARDIEAVLTHMLQQPFVRKTGIVVFGQSAGGWGSVALSSKNPAAVAGYVNFAGGRGGHRGGKLHSNCTPEALVTAAAQFGRTAKRPSLWIYTANDTFFAPDLAKRMHEAYRRGGGPAELVQLAAFDEDGHRLLSKREGVALWAPHVERFLAAAR
jgi:pimeloyl-ACP methyl ester carboxylesterase